MTRKLEGVGAVVTGGASGMGKATAAGLAAEGAGVVVFDVNADAAEASAQEIVESGGNAIAVAGDVTVAADLDRAVQAAVSHFGDLRVMINFAGLLDAAAPCSETSEDLWDRVVAVNLKGVFLGTKRAVHQMQRQGGGAIVNMASYAGFRAGGGGVAYAASKAGVIGFTRQVASEVAPAIRVNAIAPGLVLTNFLETSAELLGEINPGSPAVLAAQQRMRSGPIERIPLARGAEPEEIARLALFLATDDSSYITGQTFLIDGGGSIRNG